MATEDSHGKARTILPRSSDLRVIKAVPNPSEGRGHTGQFAPGNRHGIGARWKNSIAKIIGKGASTPEAETVARDAWRIFLAFLRAMPSDAAPVRSMAAAHARHSALAAFFDAKAAEAGFTTSEGLKLGEVALKHGQRAERLAVTAHDLATKMRKPSTKDERPEWWTPTPAKAGK